MNEKQVKTKVTEIYCGRAHSWWRHLCVLSCSPVSVSHCLLSSGLHCRRLAQACDRQGAMEASALTFTPVSDTLCLRFAKNEGLILIEVQSRLFFFSFSCVCLIFCFDVTVLLSHTSVSSVTCVCLIFASNCPFFLQIKSWLIELLPCGDLEFLLLKAW